MTTLAAAAVDRGDDAVAADGVGQRLREREIGRAVLEQRRAGDDLLRAGGEHVARALDGADAAADAARQAPAICRTSARLSPLPIAASRSITCTLGNCSKRRTQRNDVVVSDRELLALHQLDDGAALEIDGGNQHGQKSRKHEDVEKGIHSRTGMPCCAEMRLQRADAGFGVVKDRRGQRGVGAAAR